jgi:hypothetical protein
MALFINGRDAMSLEDRVWYREMKKKEAEKNNEIKFIEKVEYKFPIWRFVIVITLIVWVTILLFFYMIPMAMVKSILEPVEKMLTVEEQKIAEVPKVINTPQEQKIPKNASCRMFYDENKAVATFKIIAEPNNYYYVRLADHFNNPKLLIFVRAGDIAKVRVPLGDYELTWTRGEKWFGDKDLFGSATVFRKAVGVLKFTEEETKLGNKITGNTINFNEIRNDTPLIKSTVNEF